MSPVINGNMSVKVMLATFAFAAGIFGTIQVHGAYQYLGSDAYRKIIDNSKAINTHREVAQDETTKPFVREMLEHMIEQREKSSDITCRYEAQSLFACTAHRKFLRLFDVR